MKRKAGALNIPPFLRMNRAIQPIQAILDQVKNTGYIDTVNDLPVFNMDDQPNELVDTSYFISTFALGYAKGMAAINYTVKIKYLLLFSESIKKGSVSEKVLYGAISELAAIRRVLSRLTAKQYDIVSLIGAVE